MKNYFLIDKLSGQMLLCPTLGPILHTINSDYISNQNHIELRLVVTRSPEPTITQVTCSPNSKILPFDEIMSGYRKMVAMMRKQAQIAKKQRNLGLPVDKRPQLFLKHYFQKMY